MKEIAIQIDSQDWISVYRSLCDIAGYELHDEEFFISPPHLVKLKLDGITVERETFPPGTIHLILRLGSEIAFLLAGELAGALLFKLLEGERDTAQLTIENTIVEIEEGEIKRVVIEKLEAK